jgi:hypothetical protein
MNFKMKYCLLPVLMCDSVANKRFVVVSGLATELASQSNRHIWQPMVFATTFAFAPARLFKNTSKILSH